MKYAIFEIPSELHTELTRALISHGIEIVSTGISEDNDIILKVSYDLQMEDKIDELKGIVYFVKFFRILDRMQKRKTAHAV
ncbi:hypothetical protein BH11BAC2_BH11BAC2_20370 [soil metagenome]